MMPFEEGSVNFLTLIIILTNVFAAMFVVFLVIGKANKNKESIFLSFLIIQYALFVFPEFLYLLGLLDDFPHAVRIYVPFSLLLGPMTYFYVRTCTESTFKFTPKMGWHFIPSILDFFYQLPFYTLNGSDKLQYFYNYFLEGGRLQQPLWLTITKQILILTYVLISAWIVQKYRKNLSQTTSSIDAAFHRWLFMFCIALAVPIIGSLFDSFIDSTIFVITSMFFVILVAVALLIIKPSLFSRFPYQIELVEPAEIKRLIYESSNLQIDQKEKYLQKLMTFVEQEKPFQSPELTLSELADKVNIPVHYVSQVINEQLGVNFIDFINGYRVKLAQEMLADPKLSHYTIISIAYEAGFKAKSTFYSVFKKLTGMTPSQYRKQD